MARSRHPGRGCDCSASRLGFEIHTITSARIAATRQRAPRRQHDDTNRQPGSDVRCFFGCSRLGRIHSRTRVSNGKAGDLCDRAAPPQTQDRCLNSRNRIISSSLWDRAVSFPRTRVERPFDQPLHWFVDLTITPAIAVKLELSFITFRELYSNASISPERAA